MNKSNLRAAVGGILVCALVQMAGGYLREKSEQKRLNSVRPDYAGNLLGPVCLLQRDGGEVYVITDVDEKAGVYTGVRIVLMLQGEFKIAFRDMNERPDLKVIPCR